jgi:hypothetical protein
MRQYLFLLLVLAVLVTAGCVEEITPETNVTTTQTPVTTTVPADTPARTPQPVPAEMGYLSNIICSIGVKTKDTYHCNGDVRIRSGASHEVQVVARYKDGNTFYSGIFDLGGSNPISMPFAIFPDLKYKSQNPDYFVKLDNAEYPVFWSGSYGVAWSNRS